MRVSPNGDVTVLTGVTSPGSGNETGIAQIVADALGCDSTGSASSRATPRPARGASATTAPGASSWAAPRHISPRPEIREKMLTVAANMLEVAAEDLEAADGRVFVRGAPEPVVTLDEIAAEVYSQPARQEHGRHRAALEVARHFRIGNVYHQPEKQGRFSAYPSWPNGVAACIVEVDPETGYVKILRYCLVARRRDDHQPSARRCQPPRRDHAGDRRRDVRADRATTRLHSR